MCHLDFSRCRSFPGGVTSQGYLSYLSIDRRKNTGDFLPQERTRWCCWKPRKSQNKNNKHAVIKITMKVVGLISGGKDSCFSLMECMRHGHEVVALANLYPAETAPRVVGDFAEECDSHMFQTVGVSKLCPLIADCMELPLVRRPLVGISKNTSLDYGQPVPGDEVEDLFELLKEVVRRFPEVDAVCSGSILSNYQRLRVESVCRRLNLTSLAFLWQRSQQEVLASMLDAGLDAVLVKIAAMGLSPEMLGKSLTELQGKLEALNEDFGFHVCGEGGEYETVTLDCPLFKKKRIEIEKSRVVLVDDVPFAPVACLDIGSCKLVEKQTQVKEIFESSPCIKTRGEGMVYLSACACKEQESRSFSQATRETLLIVVERLKEDGFDLGEHTVFVYLHVADMNKFQVINQAYCTFFEGCPAPSRACVEIEMLPRKKVSMSVFAVKEPRREVLHVRSISLWAPVCIGPYAQANTLAELGMFTCVSGQIALDPATMQMTYANGPVIQQAELAMNHCKAILNTKGLGLTDIVSGVVYVAESANSRRNLNQLGALFHDKVKYCIVVVRRLPRDALVEIVLRACGVEALMENRFENNAYISSYRLSESNTVVNHHMSIRMEEEETGIEDRLASTPTDRLFATIFYDCTTKAGANFAKRFSNEFEIVPVSRIIHGSDEHNSRIVACASFTRFIFPQS